MRKIIAQAPFCFSFELLVSLRRGLEKFQLMLGENEFFRKRSPSPQPLPMPELHVLLRRDPKFASSSPYNVPLPSPNAIRNQRGEGRERERERERHTAEALSSTDAIDGFDGLKRYCEGCAKN